MTPSSRQPTLSPQTGVAGRRRDGARVGGGPSRGDGDGIADAGGGAGAFSAILAALTIWGLLGPAAGVVRAEDEAPKYACQRSLEAAGKPPWSAQAECEQMMLNLRNVADDRGMTLAEREQLQACVVNGLHGGASRTGLTNDCLKNQGASALAAHETPSGGQAGPSSSGSPPAQPPGGGGGETVTVKQVQAAGCAQNMIEKGVPRDQAVKACIVAVNSEAPSQQEREQAFEEYMAAECLRMKVDHVEGGSIPKGVFDGLSDYDRSIAGVCGYAPLDRAFDEIVEPRGDCEQEREKLKKEIEALWEKFRRQGTYLSPPDEQRLRELSKQYDDMKC